MTFPTLSPTVAGLHSNHAALAASQQAPPAMAKRSPITCHGELAPTAAQLERGQQAEESALN